MWLLGALLSLGICIGCTHTATADIDASLTQTDRQAGTQAATPPWSSITTFGNHRFRIPVPPGASDAVAFTAELRWRRAGSDANVTNGLVLFCVDSPGSCSASFNESLANATVLNSSRLSALVAIDARRLPAGTSAVHAYYMPFSRGPNGYGEQVQYLTAGDLPHNSPVTAAWRPTAGFSACTACW